MSLYSQGPDVERVIEPDTYYATLDLAPIAADLLAAVVRGVVDARENLAWLDLLDTVSREPRSARVVEVAARIAHSITTTPDTPWLVPLHPIAAEKLAEDMERAVEEPADCRHGCGQFVQEGEECCHDSEEGVSHRQCYPRPVPVGAWRRGGAARSLQPGPVMDARDEHDETLGEDVATGWGA